MLEYIMSQHVHFADPYTTPCCNVFVLYAKKCFASLVFSFKCDALCVMRLLNECLITTSCFSSEKSPRWWRDPLCSCCSDSHSHYSFYCYTQFFKLVVSIEVALAWWASQSRQSVNVFSGVSAAILWLESLGLSIVILLVTARKLEKQ